MDNVVSYEYSSRENSSPENNFLSTIEHSDESIVNNYLNITILKFILKTLNDRKVGGKVNKRIFRVDKILTMNKKNCKYVGGINNIEIKTHLEIKFTSPDENGTICISILLDKYQDLIYKIQSEF
jgi:hypothetical protein